MSEKQKFDYAKFESLSGKELGFYCIQENNQIGIDEDFLQYFRNNNSKMDDVHLEMALFLLGKYRCKDAYYELLNYLDYHYRPVRFVAIKAIASLEKSEFDEVILDRINDILRKNPNIHDYLELKDNLTEFGFE